MERQPRSDDHDGIRQSSTPQQRIEEAVDSGRRCIAAREGCHGQTKIVTNFAAQLSDDLQAAHLPRIASVKFEAYEKRIFSPKYSFKSSQTAGYARLAQGLHEHRLPVTTETHQYKEQVTESACRTRSRMVL
jgi:hypothetical protein